MRIASSAVYNRVLLFVLVRFSFPLPLFPAFLQPTPHPRSPPISCSLRPCPTPPLHSCLPFHLPSVASFLPLFLPIDCPASSLSVLLPHVLHALASHRAAGCCTKHQAGCHGCRALPAGPCQHLVLCRQLSSQLLTGCPPVYAADWLPPCVYAVQKEADGICRAMLDASPTTTGRSHSTDRM